MEPVFIVAIMITLLFALSKVVEVKYFSGDDAKPLKEVVRDGILVWVCSITGSYIYFYFHTYITYFFNVVTETKVLNTATTQIFTDQPGF
jgi:hypothetical protein